MKRRLLLISKHWRWVPNTYSLWHWLGNTSLTLILPSGGGLHALCLLQRPVQQVYDWKHHPENGVRWSSRLQYFWQGSELNNNKLHLLIMKLFLSACHTGKLWLLLSLSNRTWPLYATWTSCYWSPTSICRPISCSGCPLSSPCCSAWRWYKSNYMSYTGQRLCSSFVCPIIGRWQ